MNNELLSVIGLAKKANKLIYGETLIKNFSSVKFLFIFNDISNGSLKRLLNKAHFYKVDYYQDLDSEVVSKFIGKRNIKAIGIIDDNFKKLFIKKLLRKQGGKDGETN